MMISLSSSYLIWIWWRSHLCYHTWCEYENVLITFIILGITLMISWKSYLVWRKWWDHNQRHIDFVDDDIITIIILDVTLIITSIKSWFIPLWWWSHHCYHTWLCWWWSHHNTRHDFNDDYDDITVNMIMIMIASLDVTLMIILSV